jgi:hypothetical protein
MKKESLGSSLLLIITISALSQVSLALDPAVTSTPPTAGGAAISLEETGVDPAKPINELPLPDFMPYPVF